MDEVRVGTVVSEGKADVPYRLVMEFENDQVHKTYEKHSVHPKCNQSELLPRSAKVKVINLEVYYNPEAKWNSEEGSSLNNTRF